MAPSISPSQRLLLLLLCAGSWTVTAAEQPLQSSSYVIDVPVVSATPIEVTRVVERPEKVCRRLSHTDYRRNGGWESDWQPERRAYDTYSHYDSYGHSYGRERSGRGEGGGVGAQILGGLIGGAIGNQFGGGRGKKALTITGALIGSSIARGSSTERPRYERYGEYREIQPEYECHTATRTRQVTEVTGYDVTYRYNNSLHKRRMEHDPGDTLELRVRAVPEVGPDV